MFWALKSCISLSLYTKPSLPMAKYTFTSSLLFYGDIIYWNLLLTVTEWGLWKHKMEFSCVCSFPSVCVCSVCTVLYVFTERTCVCVCHVCVCVCVMVGRPSQAHELAMIHAGAYSMFIHRTMCVCLRVWLCVSVNVCVYSPWPIMLFSFLQKTREKSSWFGAPPLGWPGIPQGLWLWVIHGEHFTSVSLAWPCA